MSQTISLSTTDATRSRVASLLDRLFPPPRAFGVRLWDGTELPSVERPTFTLVLNHPGALRRMFTPPVELSLGEAFICGDFDIEGDIFSAFSLVDAITARTFSPEDIAALTRVNRLEAKRADVIKTAGEVTYRTWRLYMSAAMHGFESGNINVNQTLLAKMDNGRSHVPLTRADVYSAL